MPARTAARKRAAIPPLSELLRVPAAESYARLDERTLRRRAEEGRLTRYQIGRVTYYSKVELDSLVTRREGGAA